MMIDEYISNYLSVEGHVGQYARFLSRVVLEIGEDQANGLFQNVESVQGFVSEEFNPEMPYSPIYVIVDEQPFQDPTQGLP